MGLNVIKKNFNFFLSGIYKLNSIKIIKARYFNFSIQLCGSEKKNIKHTTIKMYENS